MTIGIYKITNKKTGKIYIGQSDNCERRIQEHQKKKILTIDEWITFLGINEFNFEIIEECNKEELDEKEKYYIQKYDSLNNGYNIQEGGFNNSSGEGNGRARLTLEDVKNIRTAYKNHISCKKEYEKYQDKISFNQFQAVWQGRSWSNIMPEVFTEENKQFYKSGIVQETASLTTDEVLKYREYYVDHTMPETYNFMISEKGENFLKPNTFKKIITGDVREGSVYKTIPVYKKQLKQWIKI